MKTARDKSFLIAVLALATVSAPGAPRAGDPPAIGVGAYALGQGPGGANGFSVGRGAANEGVRFIGRGYGWGYRGFYPGSARLTCRWMNVREQVNM